MMKILEESLICEELFYELDLSSAAGSVFVLQRAAELTVSLYDKFNMEFMI